VEKKNYVNLKQDPYQSVDYIQSQEEVEEQQQQQ
jgi:hypothetical protein